MPATAATRKRGKLASGDRAGTGAGKRRRKVSVVFLKAGIRPAPGTTVIPPSSPPFPSWAPSTHSRPFSRDSNWSQLRFSDCRPNPGLRFLVPEPCRDRKGPLVSAGVVGNPDL